MSPNDERIQPGGEAILAEELAAETAAELPDREAMSLIAGPGGPGSLPMVENPFYVPPDPLDAPVAADSAPPDPMS